MAARVKIEKVDAGPNHKTMRMAIVGDNQQQSVKKTEQSETEDDADVGGEGESSSFDQVIYINPDWRLAWDGLQYYCQTRKVREKSGKVHWKTLGYVSRLGEAIVFLMLRRVYTVPGVYGPDAIGKMEDALDEMKAELRRMLGDEHFLNHKLKREMSRMNRK